MPNPSTSGRKVQDIANCIVEGVRQTNADDVVLMAALSMFLDHVCKQYPTTRGYIIRSLQAIIDDLSKAGN